MPAHRWSTVVTLLAALASTTDFAKARSQLASSLATHRVQDHGELIGALAATGAPAQLVHINSSMQEDAPKVLDLLRGARLRGVDVATEAYPYATAMTGIDGAMFDDWATWPNEKFHRYEWAETGERLTRDTFGRYRERGGLVAIHPPDSLTGEAWVRAALADSLTIIASDGVLERGRGHRGAKRGAGRRAASGPRNSRARGMGAPLISNNNSRIAEFR